MNNNNIHRSLLRVIISYRVKIISDIEVDQIICYLDTMARRSFI